MAKQGVKKEKRGGAMSLPQIEQMINAYNTINGTHYMLTSQMEKEIWTGKIYAFAVQDGMDAMHLMLAEEFGFGPERQLRAHNAYDKKWNEIRDLEMNDTEDCEYAIETVEKSLKACCGPYYQPREERYNITIKYNGVEVAFTEDGNGRKN